MKKIILLLSCFLLVQSNSAQTSDPYTTNDYKNDSINVYQQGNINLVGSPVEIDLPNGYIFIDEQISKDILVEYWGNPLSSVSNVIGMIIPEATSTVEEIDRYWIISIYENVGHVQDKQDRNMVFSDFLDGLKNSEYYKDTYIEWAWSPHYDAENHILSLPISFSKQDISGLQYRQLLFGNTDVISIETSVPLYDIDWVRDNYDEIGKSVSYTPGSRYEDFNENSQQYAYNSVSSFLQPTMSSSGTSFDFENEGRDKASFGLSVITWIGKIALILIGIMMILMIGVTLTNVRKESSKSILRLVINVLLRIAVFGVVYLLLLTLAVALIWLGGWLTILILTNYISIGTIAGVFGGWTIIGSFLYAIIRSLFVSRHSEPSIRLEITESDAPKLFALIREISGATGEQMPKHTYVSPDVNACVFYDRPIANLFLYRRKNIEIGLGLLFGLNKQELKAVIAHEYGHFGQKSMRVKQVVSICYNVISNLANAEAASFVRPILKKTFLYVQRGFMTLSRAMEYEADESSASIAGKKASISALCKIEVISERFNEYNEFLTEIYKSKHGLPSSYWVGYELFESLSEKSNGIKFESSDIVLEPMQKSFRSRVKLKNVWISHPLIDQRIENIARNITRVDEFQSESIRDLVPDKVYEEISEEIMRNSGFSEGIILSEKQYKEILSVELADHSFPLYMKPFFNRELEHFDASEEVHTDSSVETVFSASNTQLVESFTQAILDFQTMMSFKNKQTTEKEIQYEGRVYTRKTVPVNAQLEIIKEMEPKILSIDKSVFSLATSRATNKELIVNAYENIFYSQATIRHISNKILPLRDMVARQIGTGGKKDEQTFNRIRGILINFKLTMKHLVDDLEMERLNPVIHVDMVKYINRVDDENLFNYSSIGGDEIDYILGLPNQIIVQFQSLNYFSKKIVTDTIEGNSPLRYWNGSVASQKF